MTDFAHPDRPAVRLNVREVGDGPPVVFLHGWGMSLEVWQYQVLALEGRFRTICVDLRGHGDSPKPGGRYGYEDHFSDLTALFERLGLTDGVTLVGWSMGGGVAAYFAARTPAVARLVLVGAPPRFQADDDAPYGLPPDACQAFHVAISSQREKTMWRTVEDTLEREMGDAVNRWLYGLSLNTPLWSALRSYEGVLAADVRPELRAMTIPVLLLHGVHDVYISIEAARWGAANIPGARLVEFSKSGHAPFLEQPEDFNAALGSFLPSAQGEA